MKTAVDKYTISKKNLPSIVVDFIKEAILTGKYREGHHLLETEIAMTLGISRAPVREAIRELENEGIVQTFPRKGTFVTRFTLEDIEEVFDIRMLLENNIFKILIHENKLSEEDFLALEQLVMEMEKIAESTMELTEKSLQLNVKDMEFHRFLWRKSGSLRRVRMLESIFFQLRMAMLYDTNETGDLSKTATDHYRIIEALRSQDIEQCKAALAEHITTFGDHELLG